KSGVNHTSRGSISTSTLPSIKLRKCSSKIITSILSFISGRLATKSNQIKQLIRNGRSASLQRTFKKSFTSFRSEERFSRNAETDLVCRLLLEKKKQHTICAITVSSDLLVLASLQPSSGTTQSHCQTTTQ